jgi:uncharacterized metal-binding protein
VSNGRTHAIASSVLAAGFLLSGGWQEAVGALTGVLLSPDLDVDRGFSGDAYIRNRFGRVFEFGWDVFWYPYRKFAKHGSLISHGPIIGTTGRLLYLFVALLIFYFILKMIFPHLDVTQELVWWWETAVRYRRVIVGLAGSDFIHYMLDLLTTEHKQKEPTTLVGHVTN